MEKKFVMRNDEIFFLLLLSWWLRLEESRRLKFALLSYIPYSQMPIELCLKSTLYWWLVLHILNSNLIFLVWTFLICNTWTKSFGIFWKPTTEWKNVLWLKRGPSLHPCMNLCMLFMWRPGPTAISNLAQKVHYVWRQFPPFARQHQRLSDILKYFNVFPSGWLMSGFSFSCTLLGMAKHHFPLFWVRPFLEPS